MTYQLRNIVVAVVLGAVALVFTTLYVTNYRKHVQQGQNQVGVLVAATDIPSGTTGAAIVSGHMLKQVTVPRTALTPGAISSPDQIVRLVTTDQIMAGEQVSTRRFGELDGARRPRSAERDDARGADRRERESGACRHAPCR